MDPFLLHRLHYFHWAAVQRIRVQTACSVFPELALVQSQEHGAFQPDALPMILRARVEESE